MLSSAPLDFGQHADQRFSDTKSAKHKVIGFRDEAPRYSDDGLRTVKYITHALRQQPEIRLELRGCADSGRDGDKASSRSFKELAAQRAKSVRRTLIRQGISPSRISIVYPMLWSRHRTLVAWGRASKPACFPFKECIQNFPNPVTGQHRQAPLGFTRSLTGEKTLP